jgi:predicted flap endonuclease-1-like 5' DNA nuclease
MNIEDLEGIGPVLAGKLRDAGVTTVEGLLDRAGPAAGRRALAESSGIDAGQLLKWVNHADLYRLDGVGSEFAELLEAAGVDSIAELAQRNAANLAQTFQEVDAARPNWVRRVPSQAEIEGWIGQAAALPKVVSH